MASKAWRMDEEDKIRLGRYIIATIESDGEFPRTAREGKKLLEEELGIVFEGEVCGVLFHESDADGVMHISVPPREAVRERYQNADAYRIPQTYSDVALEKTQLTSQEIYQFRIGDYTISHCG